jgi:Flp pilus assembly protein TadD
MAKGRLTARDYLLATAVGLLSFAAFLWLSVPGLDPSQWSEVAVAARLRPPQDIFPGLWRALTYGLCSAVGIPLAVKAFSVIGAAVGGVCVGLVYLTVRLSLSFLTRMGEEHAVWTDVISPFFAAVAALFFAVADPVWRISQTFSPEQLRLLLLLVSVYVWLRWLSLGSDWRLYPLVALLGVMSAETPFAFILPPLFLLGYFRFWRCVLDGLFIAPDTLPNPNRLPRWRMFFLFLGAVGFAVWLNAAVFTAFGGVEANGWRMSDIYFRYAAGYWRVLAGASTLAGWALGLGFGLFPLVVTVRLFPGSVGDDRPLRFQTGVILVFVCFLAIMQCGAFPAARFWAFMKESVAVPSGFLLAFYVLCSSVTIALVGAVLAFECQRVYLPDTVQRPGRMLRWLVPTIAVALFALAAVHVPRNVETEMQKIVYDALEETVSECGDAKWIFTDGHLDDGLMIVAAENGRELAPLNMMSGASRWEQTMRERNFPAGSADRDNASIGIPMLLRVWAGEKPGGMNESAIQLGFEFWKREQKPLPKASGLVARESGMSAEEAERGIAAANALSERIFALEGKMESAKPSPALSEALSAVAWRLSRFARLRNDEATADRLDRNNTALKRMLSIVEYERQRTFMQLTPLEGLRIALRRADFVEARRYAAAVLRSDEDDPEANFGMGMSYLKDGRMDDAEFYLRRCLKRRPDEPAVLNNLSIICRKAKRYEEAEELARHALKMLPDSPEVKQTLTDAINKAP